MVFERLHAASSQGKKTQHNTVFQWHKAVNDILKLIYLLKHVFVGMHQISMEILSGKRITRVMFLVILVSRNSELLNRRKLYTVLVDVCLREIKAQMTYVLFAFWRDVAGHSVTTVHDHDEGLAVIGLLKGWVSTH